MTDFPVLTLLTATPLLGGVIVLGLGERKDRVASGLAIGVGAIALATCVHLWLAFDRASGTLQFTETYQWIEALRIDYRVGADGLSLMLLLLTSLVVPMAMLASWNVRQQSHLYFGLMLLLQAGLYGTFTAQNFFHWFLFWELSLIPAFFLIKLWGGAKSSSAATQFFVYTMVGSVTLLLSFLAIYLATGTFDFSRLAALAKDGSLASALSTKLGWQGLPAGLVTGIIFAGAFLGFAVKVPLMPFHSWLPATYAEAPVGTTMILTGLMSKMGLYGFIRILVPIFPDEIGSMATPLLALAVLTIVVSAAAALAQRDLKRIFAYSSINHLGYCLLALFAATGATAFSKPAGADQAAAFNGLFLQIFNHGLTAATLFWFAGILEQRANGLRGVDDFGGLRKAAPVFCGLMGVALFSSLGLPGLNGFIGEFLIFKGSLALAPAATAFAVVGLLLTAVFILGILQRVFFGPLRSQWNTFADLTTRERLMLAVPLLLMLVLGVYPQLVLAMVNSTTLEMLRALNP